MPLEPFLKRLDACGEGLAGVLRLADDFQASIEATARRRVETSNAAMAALFLRPRDPVTGEWARMDPTDGHSPYTPVAVSLVCANSAGACFRAVVGALPPKGGAADRAWKRVSLARGNVVIEQRAAESWTHAGVDGTWYSEAVTLPKRSAVPHEVLCIVRGSGG